MNDTIIQKRKLIKMGKNHFIQVLVMLFLSIGSPLLAQNTVTLKSLLQEMVDRSERASFPNPSFTCGQRSSTDPQTVAKDKPFWYGNHDCTNFLRVDSTTTIKEYVLLDEKGPGAIVRFWSTFAGEDSGKGTLRFYFDGSKVASIEGNAKKLLSGGELVGKPLAMGLSVLSNPKQWGHNLYFPLPYQSGCKITYQSDKISLKDRHGVEPGHEAIFYNINFRSYEKGTKVETYSATEFKKNSKLIESVLQQLTKQEKGLELLKLNNLALDMVLLQGDSKTLTIKGSQAIRHLALQLEAAHQEQALRSTVLEIKFDGERTIWTPIGDFFGIGYKQLYTNTWYMSASKDGMMDAYWVMPFKEKCEITIHNYGKETVKINNAKVQYNNWKWDDRSMHFGVSWHQYTNISTGRDKNLNWEEVGGPFDINFVTLQGKGVYVGDAICLFNGDYAWWGEGDEKVYVDGETFPSHLGTGSEDYYGYAWGRPETIVDHPFIAQPDGSGSVAPGFVQNTRLRALDGIPFNNSLIFDMELWHHFSTLINYAPITYWYILPGGISKIAEDTASVKHQVALKREDIISQKMTISVEAENMAVLDLGGERVFYNHYNIDYKDIWSNSAQLFWQTTHKGKKLELSFESVYNDTYNLEMLCTTHPAYGKINIYVNGRLAAANVNLSRKKISVIPVALGRFPIALGVNKITIEIVDFAEGCQQGNVGIDKLVFTK